MKHKKKWVAVLILFILVFCFIFFIKPKKETYPSLVLKGKESVFLKENQSYEEDGYEAKDSKDGNITKYVKIEDETNYQKAGVYKRIYTVQNKKGLTTKVIRTITIEKQKVPVYSDAYDKIDNKAIGWGFIRGKTGERPLAANNVTEEEIGQYNAYYLGPNEKKLYLTFDEGSNETYLKEIVDVLNKNKVKATFFLCKNYILDNPDLIREMEKEGHSIGNHTAHHKSMPSLASKDQFSSYVNEIKEVEDAYYRVTGKNIDPVYREPKGEWSYRSLAMVKDLGYKSYFWSVAYVDFLENVSKEKALSSLKDRVHNGAIYLIHPKNKGNYEAMEPFIQDMKKEGYTFDLVKNIG